MSTEEALQKAILADPEDLACRLVYADCLEERGDARGEYIRAETELARTGEARLRERVEALRKEVEPQWAITFGLRKITAIEDLVFYLREFHRSWMPSPQLKASDIPKHIPPGLALLYRELGGLFECQAGRSGMRPFAGQDALLSPKSLGLVDGMIEFAWENQGNWSCRFPPGEADPPIYSDFEGSQFRQICPSLNHFLITMCLQEAIFSAPYLIRFDEEDTSQAITVPCRPLWIAGQYVYEDATRDFYDIPGRDVLILDDPLSGLWLASHTDGCRQLIRPGVLYG
jgi:uncharacterized protein (TIGR02996 family)